MHYRTFDIQTYIDRRNILRNKIGKGVILLFGNHEAPMNYKDNTYRLRQDSTFLYYFGLDVSGLAAIIDTESGEEIIFGTELTIDDIVWTGQLPSVSEMARDIGVAATRDFRQLDACIKNYKKSDRNIHYLPPYRHDNMIRISHWLNIPIHVIADHASLPLIKAVIGQCPSKKTASLKKSTVLSILQPICTLQL